MITFISKNTGTYDKTYVVKTDPYLSKIRKICQNVSYDIRVCNRLKAYTYYDFIIEYTLILRKAHALFHIKYVYKCNENFDDLKTDWNSHKSKY